jgi:hypothetical protein
MSPGCTTEDARAKRPGLNCSWTTSSRVHPNGSFDSACYEHYCLDLCSSTRSVITFMHGSARSTENQRTWPTNGPEASDGATYADATPLRGCCSGPCFGYRVFGRASAATRRGLGSCGSPSNTEFSGEAPSLAPASSAATLCWAALWLELVLAALTPLVSGNPGGS